jgi:hypothetical protein
MESHAYPFLLVITITEILMRRIAWNLFDKIPMWEILIFK